jgi:hypothetical protein
VGAMHTRSSTPILAFPRNGVRNVQKENRDREVLS